MSRSTTRWRMKEATPAVEMPSIRTTSRPRRRSCLPTLRPRLLIFRNIETHPHQQAILSANSSRMGRRRPVNEWRRRRGQRMPSCMAGQRAASEPWEWTPSSKHRYRPVHLRIPRCPQNRLICQRHLPRNRVQRTQRTAYWQTTMGYRTAKSNTNVRIHRVMNSSRLRHFMTSLGSTRGANLNRQSRPVTSLMS